MASKASTTTVFLFYLNILFFSSQALTSVPAPLPSLCPGLEVCFAVLPKVSSRCCAFIAGSSLFDLDAAVCICSTALKIRSIGSPTCMVGLILNGCGRKVPRGFACQ
ncbi:hypothetical protein F3Y22_tig00014370pilonHSYRG00071 [Hibiscus syriacus]|uniref:Hydrophobic seed protein domain-containing protein n=1 Tax=Hibiscus syriacus TaxID=106335 RepID=A0A6A3BZH6_HIBSY|nr:14 kDa proline-rich protein DC2.15-like [Hibiscus syriacus]KAE8722123.1 hypothetical protein F3Y22_tig00014370pilonHSYRG00071 [Hibiscus syriacus]